MQEAYEKGQRLRLLLLPNGQPVLHQTYAHDELAGLVSSFHPDGSVAMQATYVDGLVDGTATWWGDDGRVCATHELVAGTGHWVRYYADCTLAGEVELVGGREAGPWREYDRSGRPKSRARGGP